jgi:carbon starvation protein
VGLLLYNLKANDTLATILGLSILAILIIWGERLPVNIPGGGINIWITVLLIYCFAASVAPVHLLLQPRDYLASFLLFAGMILGYAGLCISRPVVQQPAYVGFNTAAGSIWPLMCVTVACGAISGFHSLISSGTTSKQLADERFARRIGYGGMVAEGLVAVMAVLAICAGLKNNNLQALLNEAGPINSFSMGYGEITKTILGKWGPFVAITILNAFILTTLDAATRISRYLTEELFGIKNRYLSTLIIVILGGALALTGAWQKIWPVFGASNQLVAALALLVISCWLLKRQKAVAFTIVPAIFMFLTTIAALGLELKKYFITKDYLLLGVSVALLILAFYLLIETVKSLYLNRKVPRRYT